jgi:hypothetical protein
MLLFSSCQLIVNKCLYSTNGLLLYFNDAYLLILNGVTSAIFLQNKKYTIEKTKKMSNMDPIEKPGWTQVLARSWSEQVVQKYLSAYILMIGLYIFKIIFNDVHIYLRLVRLLKAFSSITDMLLLSSCQLIVNKCLYSTNGLLLYFNDTYLLI